MEQLNLNKRDTLQLLEDMHIISWIVPHSPASQATIVEQLGFVGTMEYIITCFGSGNLGQNQATDLGDGCDFWILPFLFDNVGRRDDRGRYIDDLRLVTLYLKR